MTHIPKPMPLADPKRFKTIQDLTRLRPDCGASIDDIIAIDNGSLFVLDWSNIGSLLNPYNSPEAIYVRSHGVIVGSYICPESIPMLWRDPFLLLLFSHHLKGSHNIYKEMANMVRSFSCPSGVVLLLPFRLDTPTPFSNVLDNALAGEICVRINLPNGTYRVFYEQFETLEGVKEEYYRNIVVQKQ
jgi:hypothetical protein